MQAFRHGLFVDGAKRAVWLGLWPLLVPFPGIGWWLLGFPPDRGWLLAPMVPPLPVSLGMLVTLALVVALWGLARLALDNL